MNINQVVLTSWNLGTAISEMIGSTTLIFLVLMTRYFVAHFFSKKYSFILFSLGFTISFFIAIIMAWVIGGFINGLGQAAGIVTPLAVILISFIKNTFVSIPYVVGFQLIGALLGSLLFIAVFYAFYNFIGDKINSNFKIEIRKIIETEHLSFGKHTIKEIIFQFFFVVSLGFIGYLDVITYGLEVIDKVLITLTIIFILLLISSKFNFYLFALTVSVAFLILQGIFNVFKWQNLAKTLIAFWIQFLTIYLVSLSLNAIVLASGRFFEL
ncbi:MAG4940 family membrane protein [[Mycoplasma] mobile]|uniref:Hypothetical membrane protein n=1 Tax=Mycoplasma mobile (strain ATCC 43663 / 163K / NCTC 11711) TaxID=267748 RepID=Q6KHM8_MYCM1|nr:hypothetical protein [[Mycoplasma] mobile]AAT27902.1 hypothetical membrane protein [Mycoplasma mobile 163K]